MINWNLLEEVYEHLEEIDRMSEYFDPDLAYEAQCQAREDEETLQLANHMGIHITMID